MACPVWPATTPNPARSAADRPAWLTAPRRLALLLPLLASACATHHPRTASTTPRTQGPVAHGPSVIDDHVPPFATVPWQPFSRAAVVAIAQREWRLFGSPIDDDPPDTRPPPPPEYKPEREEGLWQRVGEYWWEGQDPGEREVAWTGKHDENGVIFDAANDGNFAWSAAFISYVMRIAGAGADFPYSPNHATYINAAASGTSRILRAYAPQSYAPQPGDLICLGRGRSAVLTFANLPTADLFPAHCDIVTAVSPQELTVIGGNVDDAVTLKHVPLGPGGLLSGPDGRIVDTRYPWMVVIKVLYGDTPPPVPAPAPTPVPAASPPASGPAVAPAPALTTALPSPATAVPQPSALLPPPAGAPPAAATAPAPATTAPVPQPQPVPQAVPQPAQPQPKPVPQK